MAQLKKAPLRGLLTGLGISEIGFLCSASSVLAVSWLRNEKAVPMRRRAEARRAFSPPSLRNHRLYSGAVNQVGFGSEDHDGVLVQTLDHLSLLVVQKADFQ
jgi:hypothetical protein